MNSPTNDSLRACLAGKGGLNMISGLLQSNWWRLLATFHGATRFLLWMFATLLYIMKKMSEE